MRNSVFSLIPIFVLSSLLFWGCQEATSQADETTEKASLNLDLNDPADNMTAFVKVRGSLNSGEEVIYYANGKIYGFVGGERDKPLYGI